MDTKGTRWDTPILVVVGGGSPGDSPYWHCGEFPPLDQPAHQCIVSFASVCIVLCVCFCVSTVLVMFCRQPDNTAKEWRRKDDKRTSGVKVNQLIAHNLCLVCSKFNKIMIFWSLERTLSNGMISWKFFEAAHLLTITHLVPMWTCSSLRISIEISCIQNV